MSDQIKEVLRVLVIEDENEIREFLISQFIEAGFQAMGLDSGDKVKQTLQSFTPTLYFLIR